MVRGRLIIGLGLFLAGATVHAQAPTYHKDIAPLLQKHCQDCHRPGQVAPFALMTFEQARKRARDVAHLTADRTMPPWPASTAYGGPFRDQRVLSDAEIATLKQWATTGCPEGDAKDAPPPRTFGSDWPLGEPDLVLTMNEAYELTAAGGDEFRVFVLPTKLAEDRWIRAVDYRPGNRRVVHHILAGIDTSGKARDLDARDPRPGYATSGSLFGDGVLVRGFLPVWTPGTEPRFAPDGAGYLLKAGADVLMQIHYHKTGKIETDRTAIGLYLSRTPLSRRMNHEFVLPNATALNAAKAMARLKLDPRKVDPDTDGPRIFKEMMRDVLVIPAGSANHQIKVSTRTSLVTGPLKRDIVVTSVMPHMHWLGKDFKLTAILPDGKETRVPLIRIDRWNFNWQNTYVFVDPIRLPKGTWFEMEAHFDNSAKNPANPNSPPRDVTWGDETTDEMLVGVLEWFAADSEKK
jgi:hypothetical protein